MTKLEQKLKELGYEKFDNKEPIYFKNFNDNDYNKKLIFLNVRRNKIENYAVPIYKKTDFVQTCEDLEKDLEVLRKC